MNKHFFYFGDTKTEIVLTSVMAVVMLGSLVFFTWFGISELNLLLQAEARIESAGNTAMALIAVVFTIVYLRLTVFTNQTTP